MKLIKNTHFDNKLSELPIPNMLDVVFQTDWFQFSLSTLLPFIIVEVFFLRWCNIPYLIANWSHQAYKQMNPWSKLGISTLRKP